MLELRRDYELQNELEVIVKDLEIINRPLAFFQLDSTNDYAITLAKSGEPTGTVVMACSQTKGRGRLNRQWMMKEGDIALSLIVRPPFIPANWALLSIMPALAIMDALLQNSISVRLKWPNDIIFPAIDEEPLLYFLHFRKLGGILVENVFTDNELKASIIGLGLNVKANPDRKKAVPHSMALEEILPSLDRFSCLKSLLPCLDRYLSLMHAPEGAGQLLKKYRENCETLGRSVVVQQQGMMCYGRAQDIARDGSLLIHDGHNEHIVLAGDVRFL